jgi:type VI secretion system (T6SS) immunity protein Tdi1
MNAIEVLGATRAQPSEASGLLKFWRWLIPESLNPVCVTKLGDLFLADESGSVWFLDAGTGSLERIADSTDAWTRRLSDPNQLNLWSARPLVEKLEKAGLRLQEGECYTYWLSPMMGGEYELRNFKVVPIQTHFNICGPLLECVKDLHDGTRVGFKVVP